MTIDTEGVHPGEHHTVQTHCFKCGHLVAPSDKFCPECADPLQPVEKPKRKETEGEDDPPLLQPDPIDPPRNPARTLATVVALGVLALAAVYGMPKLLGGTEPIETKSPSAESPPPAVGGNMIQPGQGNGGVAGEPDQPPRRTASLASKPEARTEHRPDGGNRPPDPVIGAQAGPPPEPDDGVPVNIIANGDFALGNTGFTSGLPYTEPAANCLWSTGYTIAPTFNKPLLHRLFANDEHLSVKRSTGNEQVFFANAGGTGLLTMWSAAANCKPKTRYRISFWCQSLNGEDGGVWNPTYQIVVNGVNGPAQKCPCYDYGEQSMLWFSGDATTAAVKIMRLPMNHNGGLIAICNISMVETH